MISYYICRNLRCRGSEIEHRRLLDHNQGVGSLYTRLFGVVYPRNPVHSSPFYVRLGQNAPSFFPMNSHAIAFQKRKGHLAECPEPTCCDILLF